MSLKKTKSILSGVLLAVTFLLVIFFVITRIQGKTPELFGYQILRVVSPSMEPELKVGDIILSRRVDDVSTLEVGDIITYRGEFGNYIGKRITHKVVVVPYEVGGMYYLQTQGIANEYKDPEICEDQVIGKTICVIPILGSIFNFFVTPWGLIFILAFLALLFINEIFVLKGNTKNIDENKEYE